MKILHINTWDYVGGAAIGMHILHNEMLKQGIDSNILVKYKTLDDKRIHTYCNHSDALKKKILDITPLHFYPSRSSNLFSNALLNSNDLLNKIEQIDPDIIHLHWICDGMLKIEDIKKISQPIIWTLRDMWPFTGGCHHAISCDKYISGCGQCISLGSKINDDLSKKNLERKIKYYPTNMIIIGISNWISSEARKSLLFKDFHIQTIFNCIDTKSFHPINKQDARKKLGINTFKKIILVGAQDLTNYHKGLSFFLKAIEQLDHNKYFLIFFGNILTEELNINKFEYKSFGFVKEKDFLNTIYSSSDMFVAPSLIEPFGKTIAEAMACKIPVVSFDVTGPRDIISHKINGYKAKNLDSHDLASGIEWIINSKNYENISKNARDKVLERFSPSGIVKQYLKVYSKVYINKKLNNKIYPKIKYIDDLVNNNEIKNFSSLIYSLPKMKYIIYGYGGIGMIIADLIPENIVGFVDMDNSKINYSNIHHPDKLSSLKYDKIIISVIGRENEIENYLLNQLNITSNKIIKISSY